MKAWFFHLMDFSFRDLYRVKGRKVFQICMFSGKIVTLNLILCSKYTIKPLAYLQSSPHLTGILQVAHDSCFIVTAHIDTMERNQVLLLMNISSFKG
jgi:hypothetical protein